MRELAHSDQRTATTESHDLAVPQTFQAEALRANTLRRAETRATGAATLSQTLLRA